MKRILSAALTDDNSNENKERKTTETATGEGDDDGEGEGESKHAACLSGQQQLRPHTHTRRQTGRVLPFLLHKPRRQVCKIPSFFNTCIIYYIHNL